MQKSISLFFILCFVVLANTSTHAQKTLSLNEAIQTALKNSYDIQLVENNLAIAKNNNNIGVAGGLPTITNTSNNNIALINGFNSGFKSQAVKEHFVSNLCYKLGYDTR